MTIKSPVLPGIENGTEVIFSDLGVVKGINCTSQRFIGSYIKVKNVIKCDEIHLPLFSGFNSMKSKILSAS